MKLLITLISLIIASNFKKINSEPNEPNQIEAFISSERINLKKKIHYYLLKEDSLTLQLSTYYSICNFDEKNSVLKIKVLKKAYFFKAFQEGDLCFNVCMEDALVKGRFIDDINEICVHIGKRNFIEKLINRIK